MPRKSTGKKGAHINLQICNGTKHLTKQEIEDAQAALIEIGSEDLICPDYIRDDIKAFEKWMEIMALHEATKDLRVISSGDTGIIARYCKTHSEYLDLCEKRKYFNRVDHIEPEDMGILIGIDKAINSKLSQLANMEDRLFLNPLSKAKNKLKKDPQEVKRKPVDEFDL